MQNFFFSFLFSFLFFFFLFFFFFFFFFGGCGGFGGGGGGWLGMYLFELKSWRQLVIKKGMFVSHSTRYINISLFSFYEIYCQSSIYTRSSIVGIPSDYTLSCLYA